MQSQSSQRAPQEKAAVVLGIIAVSLVAVATFGGGQTVDQRLLQGDIVNKDVDLEEFDLQVDDMCNVEPVIGSECSFIFRASNVQNGDSVRGAYITINNRPDFFEVVDLDPLTTEYTLALSPGWTVNDNLSSNPERTNIIMSLNGPALQTSADIVKITFSVKGAPANVTMTLPGGIKIGGGYFSVCEGDCALPGNPQDRAYQSADLFVRVKQLFTVSKAGAGQGTVTSAPTGMNCGSVCSKYFNLNSTVTLTAAPVAGSTFVGWSGACSGTGNCTVTMDSAKTATATFNLLPPVQHTLTVSKAGTGAGTVTSNPAGINCNADCSEPYNVGTAVTLTAAPNADNTFVGWSGAGCAGTGSCTVTMSTAKGVTATFNAIQYYTFTVTSSDTASGTVTSAPAGINCGTDCSESYAQGTVVNFTATPAAGFVFTGWTGACSGTGTCTVTMNVASDVTASFGSECSFVAGDVNGDGSVTNSDGIMIRDYTLAERVLTTCEAKAADVNGDSNITNADLVEHLDYQVGNIDSFDIQ